MSESASWALQKSIVEALRLDSALISLLGGARVFDHVPQGMSYPYVTIGHSIARDWSSSSHEGCEHLLSLHVWSKARGKKRVHQIMKALSVVLHEGALSLEGHHLVNLRREYQEARLDADGETYHGIVRFRAVSEPV